MKIKNKKNKGFTLFELLVSISIIAVLTAVAVVSFGGLNKKTRDARRMADLEKIRIALESAKQIGTTYPSSLNNLVGGSYLDRLPTDPKTNANYSYVRGSDNRSYYVCSTVELLSSTTPSPSGCSGLPSGYVGYNRVTNP